MKARPREDGCGDLGGKCAPTPLITEGYVLALVNRLRCKHLRRVTHFNASICRFVRSTCCHESLLPANQRRELLQLRPKIECGAISDGTATTNHGGWKKIQRKAETRYLGARHGACGCTCGRRVMSETRTMWKARRPSLPRSPAKPSGYGTLLVPVTNCSSRARIASSHDSTSCATARNHFSGQRRNE